MGKKSHDEIKKNGHLFNDSIEIYDWYNNSNVLGVWRNMESGI